MNTHQYRSHISYTCELCELYLEHFPYDPYIIHINGKCSMVFPMVELLEGSEEDRDLGPFLATSRRQPWHPIVPCVSSLANAPRLPHLTACRRSKPAPRTKKNTGSHGDDGLCSAVLGWLKDTLQQQTVPIVPKSTKISDTQNWGCLGVSFMWQKKGGSTQGRCTSGKRPQLMVSRKVAKAEEHGTKKSVPCVPSPNSSKHRVFSGSPTIQSPNTFTD